MITAQVVTPAQATALHVDNCSADLLDGDGTGIAIHPVCALSIYVTGGAATWIAAAAIPSALSVFPCNTQPVRRGASVGRHAASTELDPLPEDKRLQLKAITTEKY